MYERMLDQQEKPTLEEMQAYCGENGARFAALNHWLAQTHGTAQEIVFPYGRQYGWGISHRIKRCLICNVFAEDNAFTVMIRLSDAQFESVYPDVREKTREQIDHRYPCGNGGWLQYRVASAEDYEDIQKLLSVKCARR